MNKRLDTTTIVLSVLLGIVFLITSAITLYGWYQDSKVVVYTFTPPPSTKINSDKDHYYPHQAEAKALLVNEVLPAQGRNNTIQSDRLNMKEFMDLATVKESARSTSDESPFLVIAGSYTDATFAISKQAQLQQKGYSAKIIQFHNSPYKKLCIGRYEMRQDAEALVSDLETRHNVNAYVYNKKRD